MATHRVLTSDGIYEIDEKDLPEAIAHHATLLPEPAGATPSALHPSKAGQSALDFITQLGASTAGSSDPVLRSLGMAAATNPSGVAGAGLNAAPYAAGAAMGAIASPLGPALSIPAAGAGAAMMEPWREAGNTALGLAPLTSQPQQIHDALLAAITKGMVPEATGQGINALSNKVAQALMEHAGFGMTKGFGNLANAALENRVPAGTGSMAVAPLADVEAKRVASATDLNGLLDQLNQKGFTASIKDFKPVYSSMRNMVNNSRVGKYDLQDLADLINTFERQNGGKLDATAVNDLKQQAQEMSYGKLPVGADAKTIKQAKLEQKFWKGIADKAQHLLESADSDLGPQIAAQNEQTQSLIGLGKNLKGMQYKKAPASFAQLFMNPATTSRAALLAANPATQGVARIAPYGMDEFINQLLSQQNQGGQ